MVLTICATTADYRLSINLEEKKYFGWKYVGELIKIVSRVKGFFKR